MDTSRQPKVQTKIRVFRDGKLILDGKETPLDLHGQTDMLRLKAAGAVAIGDKLLPGDYISSDHRHRPARQVKGTDRNSVHSIRGRGINGNLATELTEGRKIK